MFTPPIELVGQLALALILGAAVGVEREIARKTAGMRTYALVALGSCMFAILSGHLLEHNAFPGMTNYDPTRLAAQVISGIGFLGAGVIIFSQSKLQGATTAAGIWVTSAIGMAVGFRFYGMAVVAAVFTIFTFVFLWFLEERVIKRFAKPEGPGERID